MTRRVSDEDCLTKQDLTYDKQKEQKLHMEVSSECADQDLMTKKAKRNKKHKKQQSSLSSDTIELTVDSVANECLGNCSKKNTNKKQGSQNFDVSKVYAD